MRDDTAVLFNLKESLLDTGHFTYIWACTFFNKTNV